MKSIYTLETMERITELTLDKIKKDIASDCSALHTRSYHSLITGQLLMMIGYGFISNDEYAELKAAMAEKEDNTK